jgi:hypothetical protein
MLIELEDPGGSQQEGAGEELPLDFEPGIR